MLCIFLNFCFGCLQNAVWPQLTTNYITTQCLLRGLPMIPSLGQLEPQTQAALGMEFTRRASGVKARNCKKTLISRLHWHALGQLRDSRQGEVSLQAVVNILQKIFSVECFYSFVFANACCVLPWMCCRGFRHVGNVLVPGSTPSRA